MSVSRPTGDQLLCFTIQTVLFDTPGVSKCLYTFFLLSHFLFFMICFICYLFVARNVSLMS